MIDILNPKVVFRHLEEDKCANVVARNQYLEGYESYIVEQWTCSRNSASLVISTYTGDPTHKIVVNVLRIPKDEALWSPMLRAYFKAVREYGARPKQTELGVLYVINLSSFPSALTVVLVPDGDPIKHRHMFIVNENLKRMGCSGRTALSLAPPSEATTAKFFSTYKIPKEKISYESAVVELVRLCQLALVVFDKFPNQTVLTDGLLCDVTEKSIRDWWAEFGTEEYDVEPNDGILGPMTVAGLLGMLLGARGRLAATGAPVPKDALDLGGVYKAIQQFQRSNRLAQTGRLDRGTLTSLKRVTSRDGKGSTSSDIFSVPRAIRSTVVEMGARAVGSSTGQVDPTLVETVNIERFIHHISGESCKYLWQGKPKKTPSIPLSSTAPSRRNSIGASGGEEVHPSKTMPSKSSTQKSPPNTGESTSNSAVYVHQDSFSSVPENTPSTTTSVSKSSVFRAVTGRMKKAGVDAFRSSQKEAVVNSRRSDPKDLNAIYQSSPPSTSYTPPLLVTAPSSPKLPPQPQQVVYQLPSAAAKSAPLASTDTYGFSSGPESLITAENPPKSDSSSLLSELPKIDSLKLRRKSTLEEPAPRNDAFYPRRLSFSIAIDALSTSGWELPFSPPCPVFSGASEQLQVTSNWAQKQLDWLTASTDALEHETEALEREFEKAELGGRMVEEAKRRLLKEVDATETKAEECKYVKESSERKVKDLVHAVGGVERKVVELEEEWEEWEGARGGRRRGWFW